MGLGLEYLVGGMCAFKGKNLGPIYSEIEWKECLESVTRHIILYCSHKRSTSKMIVLGNM